MAKIRIEHEVPDCEFCGDCGFLEHFEIDWIYGCELFGNTLDISDKSEYEALVLKCQECVNATVEEH